MITYRIPGLALAGLFALAQIAQATNVTVPPGGNIQSAINTVSAGGGGTVTLDSGTWTITSALNVPSNVTINGAGNPASTLSTSSAITILGSSASGGLSNVTIENLKLSGSGSTGSTNCSGIEFLSTGTDNTNFQVSNVQSTSFGGQAAELKRCDSSSVSSCNFHDSGATDFCHGLYIYQCASFTVSGTSLTDSPAGSGFHLNGTTDQVTIESSTCSDNGQDGMDIQGTPTNGLITGNTCDGNKNVADGGYGIRIWSGSGNCTNNTATGNAVANYSISSGWTSSGNH